MKTKRHILILILVFCSFMQVANCQYTWDWVITEGDELNEYISALVCDNEGNIYVTGSFQGTVNFFGEIIISSGGDDVFVASFDPDGNLIWVKQGGGIYEDIGRDICLADQFVYVTGGFTEQALFENETLVSNGARDLFLVKYDLTGNQLWATSGGSVTDDAGNSIVSDVNGNTYIVGDMNYTATFGSHSASAFGFTDIFLVKYNDNGECQWANSAGGSGYDSGACVEVVGDDIIISGSFNDEAIFGTSTITSVDFVDICIAHYLTDGSFVEVISAGGTNNESIQCMAVDNDLNVYVSGWYMLDITIGGNTFYSNGGYDIFLAKYKPGNGFEWAQSIGGISSDEAQGMYYDFNGDLILCGTFEDVVSFGSTQLVSDGFDDGFMLEFDTDGEIDWLFQAGGTGTLDVRDCTSDTEGNYYFAGDFVDELIVGNNTFSPAGAYDLFLAKLGESSSIFDFNMGEQLCTISIIPNPVNSETTIVYELNSESDVSIEIYDVNGKLIQWPVNEFQYPGKQEVVIDVRNINPGIYFCVLKTNEGMKTKKIIKL